MNYLYYNGRFHTTPTNTNITTSITLTIPWGFGPVLTVGKPCIGADRKQGATDILLRSEENGLFLNSHEPSNSTILADLVSSSASVCSKRLSLLLATASSAAAAAAGSSTTFATAASSPAQFAVAPVVHQFDRCGRSIEKYFRSHPLLFSQMFDESDLFNTVPWRAETV
jgi:hypothetical protein